MPNIRKTFNFRDGVQVDDEVLVVTGDRVGVGTTSPDKSLDVRGNVQVVGIITADNSIISGVGTFNTIKVGSGITLDATSGVISATSFKGDGSTLSNLPTSQWIDVNVGLGFTSITNIVYTAGSLNYFTFLDTKAYVAMDYKSHGHRGVKFAWIAFKLNDQQSTNIQTYIDKYIASGSFIKSPFKKAVVGQVGVNKISTFLKALSKSFLINVLTFCAFL